MARYVTRQLEELDAICHRWYGGTAGTVEAVLLVNPGLAELLPILPEGLVIEMPELPKPEQTTSLLRFWEAAR